MTLFLYATPSSLVGPIAVNGYTKLILKSLVKHINDQIRISLYIM